MASASDDRKENVFRNAHGQLTKMEGILEEVAEYSDGNEREEKDLMRNRRNGNHGKTCTQENSTVGRLAKCSKLVLN